ncbi:MAG: hypothetical protein HeimC3_42360 [Candidatus Heimdallarchaeota archaeon LC_3]|nr:MAG: hypothetical protein HeimC3_42360 [Candidatus Heimdallarchaeota archaeon LC_3]
MNIAMVHFRVGELDGVSLEMDKWRKVLESQFNHKVIYLAGTLGRSDGCEIPELSLSYPPAVQIKEKAFSRSLDEEQEEILELEIQSEKDLIKIKLKKFIQENEINCFIPNNIFCYPLNLPASIALAEVISEKKISTINHNHDFFWERTIYKPSCQLIKKYLEKYFPPNFENFQQVVINSSAKKNLKERNGYDSTYVPNVFYFEDPDWKKDSFNADLRKPLNINKNDIIMLQATRIVERKGIELIIDLIAELNKIENKEKLTTSPLYDGREFKKNNEIILIMPNLIEDFEYKTRLEIKCKELNVKYLFCNEFFAHQRSENDNESKIYSLWDSYTQADIISYPSLQEGWGNQFLEAVKARLPIVLFEYEVYKEDIGPMGFQTISLGSEYKQTKKLGLATISNEKIKSAAQETIKMLLNKEEREKIINKNYQIGKQKFSITALGEYLKPLVLKI